jgi:dTDP-4-dehydrorhamnose 3,5-epimerase
VLIHAVSEPLPDLKVFQSAIFRDSRGYFLESYHRRDLESIGIYTQFVQDNVSVSYKNVIRGLHFQHQPFAQAKLVTVLVGKALDVVVDIRQDSVSFGKQFSIELTEDSGQFMFVPAGFAHGFSVLSDKCVFLYKCSAVYQREAESGIRWNDPSLAIDWRVQEPIVSEKDAALPFWLTLFPV